MRGLKQRVLAVLMLGGLAAVSGAADPPAVPYPQGYREWTHVKSMVIQPGHALFEAFGGIHHLYANKTALAGYKAGGKFVDGAVIVFDLLEAKSADNTVQEGARKVVGVMVKDTRRYKSTGGWGFEGFKGDSKTERAAIATLAAEPFDHERDAAPGPPAATGWPTD